jgi:hypothetical protein
MTRHQNRGLRKGRECSRRNWAKCSDAVAEEWCLALVDRGMTRRRS